MPYLLGTLSPQTPRDLHPYRCLAVFFDNVDSEHVWHTSCSQGFECNYHANGNPLETGALGICRAASAQMQSRHCSNMGTSFGGVFAITRFFRILGALCIGARSDWAIVLAR